MMVDDKKIIVAMFSLLFLVVLMPSVSAFEWCDWIPFWDCSDPIILTDHTVFNKTSNVCTGSNLGMEVSVYPCEVQDVDRKNIQQYVDFEWTGNQQQDVGWVFMYSGQLKDAKIELFQNRTVYYKEDEYQNRWGSIVLEDVDSYINVGEPDQTCVQGNTNNSKMWEFTYINGSKERYCFTNIQQLTATSARLSGNYDKLVPVTKSKVEEGWVDVTNQINYLGNDLNNQGFDYYRVRRTVFSPDEVMKTRWTYTPARPTFFGKWSILGHDAEIGLMNSINNDKYIFLDPFWNNSWLYKKEVQLNSTSTTNLTDFPIEFNLDTQTLISSGKMNSDCSDLRVIDTDDATELSYEIEVNSCNTTYTKVYAKKPVFIENSQNDTVYVYYGNPSALDNQDAGSVWSNGYIGVMHFGNASDSINGVTWNVNNGATFEGINNLRVVNFTSASSQYLGITGTTDYRWVTDNTVYIEYNALQSGAGIHGTNTALTGGAGWSIEGGAGTNFATNWGIGFQASTQYDDDDLDTNVLKKLHFVKDDTNGTLYDTAEVMESAAFSVNDQDGRVVGRRAGASPYMQGYVNELRWTNSTRTQDWIRAESGMLSSVGAEETGSSLSIDIIEPVNGFLSTSPSIFFNCSCTDNTGCTDINMTIDGVQVNSTTGAGNTNLSVSYTNSSIPDGSYNWYCTGTSNTTEVLNSTIYSFSVDTTLPYVNVTSPVAQYGFLEGGDSVDLNWTVTEGNPDMCWYAYSPDTTLNTDDGTGYNGTTDAFYWVYVDNITTNYLRVIVDTVTATAPSIKVYNDKNQPVGDFTEFSISADGTVKNVSYALTNLTEEGWHYLQIDQSCFGGSCNDFNYITVIDNNDTSQLVSYVRAEQSVSCSLNTTTFTYSGGFDNLVFFANDTFGNANSTEVSWSIILTEFEQYYVNETVEGITNPFWTDLGTTQAIVSADLIYNGVAYSGTVTETSPNRYNVSRSLEAPSVNVTTNFTFYWNITLSGGLNAQLNSYNQTVTPIALDDCTNYTFQILNLSLFEERARTSLNGTIEVALDIQNTVNYSTVKSLGAIYSNVSNTGVCSSINLSSQDLVYSAEVKYYSGGYESELYNVQRADINGIDSISLFDLNTSYATEFVVTYKNQNFITVDEAVIQLQRKYIPTGNFEVVEAPLTGNDGTAVLHIDLDANTYKAVVVKNGEVLDIFENIVFSCENELSGECTQKLDGAVNSRTSQNIETVDDFSYSITEVDGDTISVTYTVPTGSSANVNLVLTQRDGFGNVTLCNETLISASGSMQCDYNNETITDSYLTLELVKDSTPIAVRGYRIESAGDLGFNGMNYLIVFIFILSLAGMAFSSPEFIVVNGLVVMLISGALFLLSGVNFVIGLGSLAWLMIAGGILIYKMAKQEDR